MALAYDGAIQRLIDAFGRLPGIGPKGAQRIAFYMLSAPEDEARDLAEAIEEVKDAMADVVDHGTGARAQIRGLKVAGKTGTARIESGKINSFFMGFAPFDTPTLAISVVIEGNDGSDVEGYAAAFAGKVLSSALNTQSNGSGK